VSTRRRTWWRGLLVALIGALPLVGGPGGARALSTADERQIGQEFDLAARARLPLITDVEVTQFVRRVGQRIVAALGRREFSYHFFVVRDPRINAFAVPGGYIYAHAGLLTRASNEEELAGVVGHEIAHVNAHHLARQREASKLMNHMALLGMLLSIVQPAIGAGTAAASAASQLEYQREFEQEADYLGVRYVRDAGYDPHGMLDFFKKMLDEQRTTPTFTPPYLLSHPLTERRLSNLEAVLRTPQWNRSTRATASVELERVQVLVRARMEPPQDVLMAYRRQAEANPSSGRARDLLGLAQLETGQFDAARQSFEAARQLGVASVDRDLGRAWLRLRQPAQARECLERAVQTMPDDPVAHYDLALARQADGDPVGAARAFSHAANLAPDDADAHYGLGMLLGRTGDTGRGLYHLGMAHALRGEYTEAVSCFDRALPQLPADSPERAAAQASFDQLGEYVRTGHVPRP